MKDIHYQHKLQKLFDSSKEIYIQSDDKIVILSDLHIGNTKGRDDFNQNRALFSKILIDNYFNKGYKLILNGDIEDLYKFSQKEIEKANPEIYEIFNEFHKKERLIKIRGNHDFTLNVKDCHQINNNLLDSIKLKFDLGTIFIYHGHQVSNYLDDFNYLSFFAIRYLISHLRVKNSPISINNFKKIKTESRAYGFSADKKIITIIGHTHRPLFESLSKLDVLNMRIERLIRKYPEDDTEKQKFFDELIVKYRDEIRTLHLKNNEFNLRNSIYNESILIPCLFNSGCATGKTGFTGLEIRKGKIALVYWFDKNVSKKYLDDEKIKSKQLDNSDYYKAILKSELLSYVFDRIRLLS
jgi:UDP-2,3-diacylglucosamine pyrophosphatase LpxH